VTEQDNRLIEDYLNRIERATADLPQARRTELIEDLREHIQVLRVEEPGGGEAHIRSILERLGDPEAIAAEAGAHPSVAAASTAPTNVAVPRARSRLGVWILAALSLLAVILICGSLFFFSARQGESQSDPVPVPAVSQP
jgi:uncharacterized membrane protein